MTSDTTPLLQPIKDKVTISESEFELTFKPFIQFKMLVCVNEKCRNNFSLTEEETLQLIGKENSVYELMMHTVVIATCPLCHTIQELNSGDIIGDYLAQPKIINLG